MLKLVIFLFICKVSSKDSDYCSKRVPKIDSKFDVCMDGNRTKWTKAFDEADSETVTDIDVIFKCEVFWADDNTDGYIWGKGRTYEDDCEKHKICCEMKTNLYGLDATEHLVITCTINKACNWIIPNLPWLLPVVIGVVALCLLACIISCCCGCCSGSSGGKKPKDDGSSNAALAAQQQQLVALQAATSMALMAQQQQQMAAAGGAAAPAAAADPTPAAADSYGAAPAAAADPDPFAAKPEYGSSEPASDTSAFDAAPTDAAPTEPPPEPDYGGF